LTFGQFYDTMCYIKVETIPARQSGFLFEIFRPRFIRGLFL